MYVYIASSFDLVPHIEELVKKLEENDIHPTVRWWERKMLKEKFAPLSAEEFYAEPECKYAYHRDKDGIWVADAVVFLASDVKRKYNGANVEVGMADAWGIPIFSIGVLENSAMYYGVHRCESVETLLAELQKIKKAKEEKT